MSGPPVALERVLPTLNADGTRRWIEPRQVHGRWSRRRAIVGYGLIVLFVCLPFLRMNGKPLVLIDLPRRELALFGGTFLPTDGVLLMLLMLTIFVGVVAATAVVGRAWCGWGCPQTVYLELVFRPVERWLLGHRARKSPQVPPWRRLLLHAVLAALALLVANVFLAYFVGVASLARWVQQSPVEHPGPFLVVAVTASLAYFDFAWFREQMCTVICPYARLQSVLLDRRSLIVGYDAQRGEPRAKGKARERLGDCIDCRACVVTCPTGIDIRDGLQLECIACTQCVDACDAIMADVGKPPGLLRYGSVETLLHGAPAGRLLRPRVLIYAAVVLALVGTLLFVAGRATTADVTILRGIAAPFTAEGDTVRNQIRIKVQNRGAQDRHYTIALVGFDEARMIAPENPLAVPAGTHQTTTVFVLAPRSAFGTGRHAVRFRIVDGATFDETFDYSLLGPMPGRGTP